MARLLKEVTHLAYQPQVTLGSKIIPPCRTRSKRSCVSAYTTDTYVLNQIRHSCNISTISRQHAGAHHKQLTPQLVTPIFPKLYRDTIRVTTDVRGPPHPVTVFRRVGSDL